MIHSFSNLCGIDILYVTPQGQIAHQYSRIPNENDFSFQLIDSCLGRPAITCASEIINVHYIDKKNCLSHRTVDQLSPIHPEHRSITQNIKTSVSPVSCNIGGKVYVFYIDNQEKLVEISHNISQGKQVNMRFINDEKVDKTMIKAISTSNGQGYLFFKTLDRLNWVKLGTKSDKLVVNNIVLPFELK